MVKDMTENNTRMEDVFTQINCDEFLLLADGLLEGENDEISAMANLSALIWQFLPNINWAGFYRVKNGVLVLSPFQGKPACNRIAYGKGVCGSAWEQKQTVIVPDVHEFPGHIACDSASRSEIVIPFFSAEGQVMGVLDIDSPFPSRFEEKDKELLESLIKKFEQQRTQMN